jgi:hypothetical protein
VPGAEYDRDPRKIEFQARLIASAPALHGIIRALVELVGEAPDDAPGDLQALVRKDMAVERYMQEIPAASGEPALTAHPAPAAQAAE